MSKRSIAIQKVGLVTDKSQVRKQTERLKKTSSKETQNKEYKMTNTVVPTKTDANTPKIKRYSLQSAMMQLHTENMTNIILYSNANPFKSCDSHAGCACYFCSEQLPSPAELKTHTMSEHKNVQSIQKFMSSFTLPYYKLKMDVTGLKCDLCDSPIDKLENLMRHLVDEHEKIMHFDLGNRLIPFDFSYEVFTCTDCFSKFEHFKMLLQHMNTHYSNYVCDKCAKSFVTKRSFEAHQTRHEMGEYPCPSCGKLYDTLVKRKAHEKTVHINKKMNKCHYCDMKFSSYSGKVYHMSKKHGAKDIMQCPHCNKTYFNKQALKYHLRRTHLLATKSFICDICGTGFFERKDLVRHVSTHTKLKEYKCEVCHKGYGRKSTLLEHMRIHNNDRRFKCEHCAQAFVQKCSWRGHMKSKHGEIINN